MPYSLNTTLESIHRNMLHAVRPVRATLLRLMVVTVVIASALIIPKPASAATWSGRIDFNEMSFPTASTNLLKDGGTTTLTYDFYTGSGAAGVEPLPGADGITDLTVIVTLVKSADNPWDRTEADYSTASDGSFRSDWRIESDDCSAENTYAYVKFDFHFSGALANIQAGQFITRHTSTNGESEAYEYTLVTVNGAENGTIEAKIGGYLNTDYQAGMTMSEKILESTDTDGSPGGNMAPGVWAIDDLNTTVSPPSVPEEPSTNPQTGEGAVNGDQEIDGADFGLGPSTVVSQITYYFGLQDVAFDTDGDGCTQTNTRPSAGVTWFDIGYEDPTAVELASFTGTPTADGTLLQWTTAAEIDNAGFNVSQSESANGPWLQLNDGLIPALGSPFEGADYQFHTIGNARYYLLEDVDTQGTVMSHRLKVGNDELKEPNMVTRATLYFPLIQ